MVVDLGDPAGDLEEPEPQGLDRGLAQVAVGQSEVPERGEQAGGQGDHGDPGDVDLPVPGGPPVQPDRLGLFDVVLDVDVGAVPGVQPGDLPGGRVDRDQLVAAAAGLLPVTGALGVLRMEGLVPGDDPKSGDLLGPLGQVQQPGDVGDPGVIQQGAVLVDPVLPQR